MRGAALALVTELDERVEDDLTEVILGRSIRLLTSRRGIALPQNSADLGGKRQSCQHGTRERRFGGAVSGAPQRPRRSGTSCGRTLRRPSG